MLPFHLGWWVRALSYYWNSSSFKKMQRTLILALSNISRYNDKTSRYKCLYTYDKTNC